ncbi:Extracellular solute-binding protein, family 1 [Desulfamplus magnetovallimortis]|uniref:Extracellular solute-binding protein, family 1 n=1 Tax=Desulfamplus magnetovallimortis TaxID=1246637 RepID=A0A1W1HKD6_9BACT|nr:putative 2-aminoethylphosphonate ABC transporter substrate-binding protein [Desulfamplus magnetovallimortis]SLM32920.1 Extracellular solute-binding protein, family 1 [Desulfamplus magnetovallimortis]
MKSFGKNFVSWIGSVVVFSMLMCISSTAWSEELLVYTALEDDEIPGYLELFKKEHAGIDIKIVRDSTGIITAKLLAEKDNPRADVVWGTAATSLMLCNQAGMVQPYAPKGLEKVRPKMRDKAATPAWVGIKAWMTGFCVNTIELESLGLPMPADYEDLTNPAFADQLAMPNPASSGTGFLTVSAILQSMGEEKGWDYLDRLHKNIARYTHSGSKPCKLAGAGEVPVGISFAYRGFMQKKKGEPVITVFPKSGSGWDVEANCLIKKDTIKSSAKLFLDWAISESIMKEYGKVYPVTAYDSGQPVPDGFPANPEEQLVENDFDWAAKNRVRILAEWSKRYDVKSDPK